VSIRNRVAAVRQSRGLSAAKLASMAGLSRQSIYAIESGDYVPNTTVALQLARILEVPVEELFALPNEAPLRTRSAPIRLLAPPGQPADLPLRTALVAGTLVAVPASPVSSFLPEANALLTASPHRAQVLEGPEAASGKALVLAGCDPALGILAHMVERLTGFEVLLAHASSRTAIDWLKQGLVHIAGSHLQDARTGAFNLPYVEKTLGKGRARLVTFAHWHEGFVVPRGNPRGIATAESLAQKRLRIVNRESGSGARQLLDQLLSRISQDPAQLAGYAEEASSHLAAAYRVSTGQADCCIATPSAARAYALDFVPLREERFDLVFTPDTADLPSTRALLDVLQRASLRNRLHTLAGYNAASTGTSLPIDSSPTTLQA
jgi:molybdate-binding protein/DNA-binding XRE family transcriptional regulator